MPARKRAKSRQPSTNVGHQSIDDGNSRVTEGNVNMLEDNTHSEHQISESDVKEKNFDSMSATVTNHSNLFEEIKTKIKARETELQSEIDAIMKELPPNTEIGDEIKDHIETLHVYNHYKDITQGLMGRIAEKRGVTTRSLYPEFGLELSD